MGQGDSLYSHTSKAVLFSESLGERERDFMPMVTVEKRKIVQIIKWTIFS